MVCGIGIFVDVNAQTVCTAEKSVVEFIIPVVFSADV